MRCVYDRPLEHSSDRIPLYFMNPNHVLVRIEEFILFGDEKFQLNQRSSSRHQKTWDGVVTAIQQNQLFKAVQTIVNESRQVQQGGGVILGPHFPLFRYIFNKLTIIRSYLEKPK